MNFTHNISGVRAEYDYSRRKTKRKAHEFDTHTTNDDSYEYTTINMIDELAIAIFEYGLKESSPKVLLPLMPQHAGLTSEHIKSHLQKYRKHHERLREVGSYREYLKNFFESWVSSKPLDTIPQDMALFEKDLALSTEYHEVNGSKKYEIHNNDRLNIPDSTSRDALRDAQIALADCEDMYSDIISEYEDFMKTMHQSKVRAFCAQNPEMILSSMAELTDGSSLG